MSAAVSQQNNVIAVSGMACEGCAKAVARVLSAVPGAQDVKVDLAAGRAVVHGNTQPEALLAAVRKAGYGAEFAPAA